MTRTRNSIHRGFSEHSPHKSKSLFSPIYTRQPKLGGYIRIFFCLEILFQARCLASGLAIQHDLSKRKEVRGIRFWGGLTQRPQEGPTGSWISSFPSRCQHTEDRCMAGADPTGLWARTRTFSGASEISSPHCVSGPTHAVNRNKERVVAVRRILCVMLCLPFLRRRPIKTQPPRHHARQRETIRSVLPL